MYREGAPKPHPSASTTAAGQKHDQGQRTNKDKVLLTFVTALKVLWANAGVAEGILCFYLFCSVTLNRFSCHRKVKCFRCGLTDILSSVLPFFSTREERRELYACVCNSTTGRNNNNSDSTGQNNDTPAYIPKILSCIWSLIRKSHSDVIRTQVSSWTQMNLNDGPMERKKKG